MLQLNLRFVLIVMVIGIVARIQCSPASAHIHSHANSKNLNHEREEDGAYISRDANHISDDGEHHAEFDHEAILGSAKDAEEFDTLPPEEAKRRLRILVTKMDLNNDKQIDRHELKAWIIRSFKSLSEEEAQERMEDIDENRDGKITWSEYLADSYGIDDPTVISVEDSDEEQLISDDKAMFFAADVNKDGFLDKEEFMMFNHPEEHPSMLPIIYEQTLRDKDKNKDGYIDFQEFVGERGLKHDKQWILVEKDKFENDFDKDKDGRLNKEEILSWVVPSNEEISEDEVTHLFAAADDDHDNVLSFDEIVDHHHVFVGSEATDYGDQLHDMKHFNDEL